MVKKVSIKNPKAKQQTADSWVNSRDKKRRLTIDIPISLHTKLKISAAKRSMTMGGIICTLLEERLKESA